MEGAQLSACNYNCQISIQEPRSIRNAFALSLRLRAFYVTRVRANLLDPRILTPALRPAYWGQSQMGFSPERTRSVINLISGYFGVKNFNPAYRQAGANRRRVGTGTLRFRGESKAFCQAQNSESIFTFDRKCYINFEYAILWFNGKVFSPL